MKPRLIIVTICCNNLSDVQKTCESIDCQTIHPDEHWVVDGSTNDEILTWQTKTHHGSFRHFVHERDQGISDAFNKGISLAGNGMIQLLNSGDTLLNETVLARILDFFEVTPRVQWISGRISIVDSLGNQKEFGTPFDASKLNRGMRWVAHETWWVDKRVYDQVGGYRLDLGIAMDFDMLCRISGFSYAYYEFASVAFDVGGVSNRMFSKGLWEAYQVYRDHYGHSPVLAYYQTRYILMRKLNRSSLGRAVIHVARNIRRTLSALFLSVMV
jgi:glycosyltransferase involved in cell wall biosynthesis